ncbi:hypothetical protein GE09DRAFT_1078158 [Coniochaeta sp. 2T2.1]|nr:hypothetical protein GE09DRAFT_1078158 [Coniochaeta sp. 2T2.1]
MASLSVGGNDIDFPGIIFNCILEASLPINVGIKKVPCNEQKEITWNRLVDPTLPDKIDTTIKKIVAKARSGPIGDQFKLYVTGFPQFFSVETDECDHITFARSANPNDDGKPHQKMTQEVRKEYNEMSLYLNKVIEKAVLRNTDNGPHIREPDQRNPNLWLFHYPYNEPRDEVLDGALEKAYGRLTAAVDVNVAFKTYNDFQNALLDAVELDESNTTTGWQDFFWRRGGNRFKVFHPTIPLHEKIRDLILDSYIADLQVNKTELPPPPPAHDINACHGPAKTATYNKGSVNELELSVRKLDDDSKSAVDAPDCVGRFQRAVIDGCDGHDLSNNPHNYKFGSTLTTADGWEYRMTPLSKQVNEVSCDVSYKFFFDSFEVRGKNLPDARFGAEGEGLRAQLAGCGALTKWNFERTPNDVKFQWYASGRLPIGTKNCVGDALVAAGGAGEGNCHGAGKRMSAVVAAPQPYGIDDWPGYGEESKHVFGHPATA